MNSCATQCDVEQKSAIDLRGVQWCFGPLAVPLRTCRLQVQELAEANRTYCGEQASKSPAALVAKLARVCLSQHHQQMGCQELGLPVVLAKVVPRHKGAGTLLSSRFACPLWPEKIAPSWVLSGSWELHSGRRRLPGKSASSPTQLFHRRAWH